MGRAARTQASTTTNYDVGSAIWANLRATPSKVQWSSSSITLWLIVSMWDSVRPVVAYGKDDVFMPAFWCQEKVNLLIEEGWLEQPYVIYTKCMASAFVNGQLVDGHYIHDLVVTLSFISMSKVYASSGAARTQAPTTTNYDVGSATWADLRTAPLLSAMEVTVLGHDPS
ncbi:hypothetical protein VNO77_42968 [Canavalia gladiata]|uniref:Uncharacterized protein n=1 Tax=Canavalia gladiata TaxID=3824 RepID=A0AAN9JVH4_CANGL